MATSIRPEYRPIRLAEKVMAVLAEGEFTATYKYAVLLGLIDLCIENTRASGGAPDVLTTSQLAEKIVEIYWPHTLEFHYDRKATVLIQNGGPKKSQAEVITKILQLRNDPKFDKTSSILKLRKLAPSRLETLIKNVEWKLIEMPLPRLQFYGGKEDRFLYEIDWDVDDIKMSSFTSKVRQYLKGNEKSVFDNRIMLKPGVGNDLVLLNGLLRPLVHREWSAKVAKFNNLTENKLEEFLFGVNRVSTAPVRSILTAAQDGLCFYCGIRPKQNKSLHVDHFIPWSRYPNNAIENLVLAHDKCNSKKKDYLAANEHVERWAPRLKPRSETANFLAKGARKIGWESNQQRTASVARAVYYGLPDDARLWVEGKTFEQFRRENLKNLFK